MAQRSVDQVVGNVKTEASKRPIPIDPYIAEDLLSWYRTTKYTRPEDYVDWMACISIDASWRLS